MALIAIASDKGAPGVTTAALALAAVWPRPVLLAECDQAGGDLVYRFPAAGGGHLDPRRGVLSLAVVARRGMQPQQVWEHVQKLHGGLDVLAGVTNAEQGAGLSLLWGPIGKALAALPQADVIADCGRLGADGPLYDLLVEATAVVLVSKVHVADVIRLRDRAAAFAAAAQSRGRRGFGVGVVVVAEHKKFRAALGEVQHVLGQANAPATVLGGIAHDTKGADLLSGEWGGNLDRTMLIKTAREVAQQLVQGLPPVGDPAAASPRLPRRRLPATRPAPTPASRPRGARHDPRRRPRPPDGGTPRRPPPAVPARPAQPTPVRAAFPTPPARGRPRYRPAAPDRRAAFTGPQPGEPTARARPPAAGARAGPERRQTWPRSPSPRRPSPPTRRAPRSAASWAAAAAGTRPTRRRPAAARQPDGPRRPPRPPGPNPPPPTSPPGRGHPGRGHPGRDNPGRDNPGRGHPDRAPGAGPARRPGGRPAGGGPAFSRPPMPPLTPSAGPAGSARTRRTPRTPAGAPPRGSGRDRWGPRGHARPGGE